MKNQKGGSGQNVPLPSEVFDKPPRKKNKTLLIILFMLGFIAAICGSGYMYLTKMANRDIQSPENVPAVENEDKNPTFVLSSQFSDYEEVPVNINPQVPAYTVEKDLKNVINADKFQLANEAKDLLVRNMFAVKPSDWQEFYSLYESNRYSYIPNFITTDSVLHSYHLVFDDLLKKLEEGKLSGELKTLNAAMLADSLKQYEALKGTDWESAARRNVGFFAVGSRLLDPNVQAPDIVKDEVEKEMALIDAHEKIEISPVMNIGLSQEDLEKYMLDSIKEDYSQYVPRGHYTKTDGLKAYFRSMMWYGRLTFRLKSEDEVRSALLVSSALGSKGSNQESWDKIYEPINFFVGKSDDITYYQLRDVINAVYGNDISLENLTRDKTKLAAFITEADKLEAPQVNSMPIFNSKFQPNREKEIKGFRFLGQRFTIDASIFQRLIVREVGEKKDQCSAAPFATGRMLPKGLDIPAAMGSQEAYNILQSQGETDYACYKENMGKMKTYISGLDQNVWTQNLYWGWLYSLKPLTEEKKAGYPSFMINPAWQRKSLNAYLGSWTELKRDTILYAKQAYAEMGGGSDEPEPDYRGYVEPEPYVYARLASLVKMTQTGLDKRGLINEDKKEGLNNFYEMAVTLKNISEKELNGSALTDEENDFIKSYGGNLEHIWYDVFSTDGKPELDEKTNAPVVADVATNPDKGEVLEEGTGYISEIFVVVPIDGKLRIAKGGVYSYYEFIQPMADRLTDEAWKAILKDASKKPALPEWTSSFTVK